MTPNRELLANIRREADAMRRSVVSDQVDTLATLLIDLIDAIDTDVADYVERQSAWER